MPEAMKLEIEDCLAEAAIYPADFRVRVLVNGQTNLYVTITIEEMISVLTTSLARLEEYGADLPACARTYAGGNVLVCLG